MDCYDLEYLYQSEITESRNLKLRMFREYLTNTLYFSLKQFVFKAFTFVINDLKNPYGCPGYFDYFPDNSLPEYPTEYNTIISKDCKKQDTNYKLFYILVLEELKHKHSKMMYDRVMTQYNREYHKLMFNRSVNELTKLVDKDYDIVDYNDFN